MPLAKVPLVLVASAVGAGLALVACSTILGIESERHLVTVAPPDTGTDAGPGGPDFSCLGSPPPTAGSGMVELQILVNDVTGATAGTQGTPIPGATMRACNKLDFTCTTPGPIATTVSGADGLEKIFVPSGFDGFYEVDAGSSYSPSILTRSPAFADESAQQGLVSFSLLTLGASQVNIMQDPNLGIVIATVFDCASQVAPGILFTASPLVGSERIVYFASSLPSSSATTTDTTGSAIIFNVPIQPISVQATIPGTGNRIVDQRTANVRQGWVTFIQLRDPSSKAVPIPDGG